MKQLGVLAFAATVATLVPGAWGGHELPIYPSYYPHEIEIRTVALGQAADELRTGRIQAYVGDGLSFADAPPPDKVRAVESLGSFLAVRINPDSTRLRTEASACGVAANVARELAGHVGFIPHPYPVTPFHGDYLHHADLAAAAEARFSASGNDTPVQGLTVKAGVELARSRPGWSAQATDWDVEVVEVDAAGLTAAATFSLNGWLAPPWMRTGWFHAWRLLADAAGAERRQHARSFLERLEAGDFTTLAERINLERDLVAALTDGCRATVAGYTVKRNWVNVEYSAGIENIGYDAIAGLDSPMFIRTVKLKDFPWNGWLALGIGGAPTTAWNPIGGMTDPFGRLVGFAIGDPALLPSPYEAGWMLNRVADLPSGPGR